MTVTEAFQAFKGRLELPATHSQRASTAQQQVRARIGGQLPIQDSFLSGSYARHTKIHPLNDIDVMLVRNSQRVGLAASGGIFPNQALDELFNSAKTAFPNGATINRQSRSVGLTFSSLDFGFDLIPAWLRQPSGYWIPDLDTASWVPTDPQAHERLMTGANERTGGLLKPIVKMAKHWSRRNFDLLRSFHIELICESISRTNRLESFQIGVATVLVCLPNFIGTEMLDPVYGLTRVDKILPAAQLSQLQSRVNYDAQNAIRAVQLERSGSHADAIQQWKHIFVRDFPE
jgi:hypothetical protein